jgi:WASH complex subunit strumpellin
MTEIVDFSYAWVAMDRYLVRLQETIGSNPKSVLMLKTVFIKMSTIMETPLRRIAQANSEDFESVARYYSGQLLKFIKSVLYVIPVNIFKELDLVSQIMSKDVKEFKVKINKDTLKEQTLFDQRFILAKKTHEITLLTQGMLVLDRTMMGIIELDPKEILVDGLRKELCRKLSTMLHYEFIFDQPVVKKGQVQEKKFFN